MKLFISVIILMSSAFANAQCTRPEAPQLPDGDTADMQAMIEGQKTVKAYVTGTEAYLDCLASEGEKAGEEANPDVEMARIEKHNAAVDEMEKVANEFNEEIQEYKAKAK